MTTPVYDFPPEWYSFSTATFRIQSRSQVANRTWIGGNSIKGPHAQAWVAQFTLNNMLDPTRQDIAAFFSRLDGQAGLIRIGDPSRLRPWYDRNLTSPSTSSWSDGSRFSDGSLFANGFLPANVFVAAAASKGDKAIVLGGFPLSTSAVLRRGDLIQIKPNGIADSCPNLYEVSVGGASDASGAIGVEVRPRLRAAFAIGDQASLRYPASVFRCIDDDQGVLAVTPPVIGNGGFSLIEALDQVP